MQRRALLLLAPVLALMLPLTGCLVYDESPTPTPEPPSPEPATTVPTPTVDVSPISTPPAPAAASLYFAPSVLSLAVGETGAIDIWVDGAHQLNGIVVEIGFDPAFVEIEDADPQADGIQIAQGSIPQPTQVVENLVAAEEGRIRYQVALGPGVATDGTGVVATIPLRGSAEGAFQIRFENVAASNPAGDPLDLMPLADGFVTISGQADIASPEPSPSPPSAPTTTPPAVQPTAPPTAQSTGQGIYYVVQPGENLFRIGLRFGSTAEAIATASGISDPSRVTAGTMVLIPVAPPGGSYAYVVQRGDTLFSIATRFGTTVDDLTVLNGLGANPQLAVGQILIVVP